MIQTLIGKQKKRLIDQDTGEVYEVDQITKRSLSQKQFWKVYLIDFLQILGVLNSKQVEVLIYILESVNPSNNTYIGTFRKTAEGSGVSLDTTRRVIKKLQEQKDGSGIPFLKKVQNGVYQVSPNIMMKGSDHKKSLLLNYYDDSAVVRLETRL
nr:putative plasmid replication protein [uncultured bacterium]